MSYVSRDGRFATLQDAPVDRPTLYMQVPHSHPRATSSSRMKPLHLPILNADHGGALFSHYMTLEHLQDNSSADIQAATCGSWAFLKCLSLRCEAWPIVSAACYRREIQGMSMPISENTQGIQQEVRRLKVPGKYAYRHSYQRSADMSVSGSWVTKL